MPAPALRGGHGQSRSGHGRSMKNSYLCAPRLGVSVKGCQPFASDVPDSRRAALFDLPGLKVKEFTFMPGAGAVIFRHGGPGGMARLERCGNVQIERGAELDDGGVAGSK